MKIRNMFLCGPMTGSVADDWPAFKKYKAKLAKEGINATDPLELIKNRLKDNPDLELPAEASVEKRNFDQFCCLRFCLDALPFHQAVYLMPGWESSLMAIVICFTAQELGLDIFRHDNKGSLIKVRMIGIGIKFGKILDFGSAIGSDQDDDFDFSEEEEIADEEVKDLPLKKGDKFSEKEGRLKDWFEKQVKDLDLD